jgi:hypothetical protein
MPEVQVERMMPDLVPKPMTENIKMVDFTPAVREPCLHPFEVHPARVTVE